MNNDHLLLNEKPLIMGILNVTPDSFYDGNKYNNTNSIKSRIMEMIESNVDIIDIGGESTRPGANPLSFNEELTYLNGIILLFPYKHRKFIIFPYFLLFIIFLASLTEE